MTGCSVATCDRPHRARGFCGLHFQRWRRHGDPLAGRTPEGATLSFIERAVRHLGDDCLPWPYGKTTNGYGQVLVGGSMQLAHRVVLERTAGPQPGPDMQAAHAPGICHNRACVNPHHLRWATIAENHADKIIDGTHARGERHPMVKLTAADVLAIRSSDRRGRALASEFGVHEATISDIRTRKTWAWLDAAPATQPEEGHD